MYCVYRNIRTYSYSEHHSGLVIIVSASADVFWILSPGHRLASPGFSHWLLMYVEQGARHDIATIIFNDHLHLLGFINLNIHNACSLIDPHNARVIPGTVWFSRYGITALINPSNHLKIRTRKFKSIVVWIFCHPDYLVSHIISKLVIIITCLSLYVHVNWNHSAMGLVMAPTLIIYFGLFFLGGL